MAFAFLLIVVGPSWGSIGNLGTDFWLAFPHADHLDTDTGRSDSLLVTSEINTSGQVQIPGIGYSATSSMPAGSTTVLSIPLSAELDMSDAGSQLGIHLTALNPVAVYGISYEPHSTDGYLACRSMRWGTGFSTRKVLTGKRILDFKPLLSLKRLDI